MQRSAEHEGEVIEVVEESSIVDCTQCGFIHVQPLPDSDELKKFYEKEFYDKEKPDYLKYAEEDLEWWMATYNHYYDLFEKHTEGRRLLDIGSGPGYFLDAGVHRGWDVLGFEPSASAAAYAAKRGRNVVNDTFSREKAAPHGLFDVVMLSLVLEHVPDPARVLAEAKQILKPNGLLCVIVPNDYNPLQKLLVAEHGFSPWWVVPTHHLNYFTIESLTQLTRAKGLTPLHIETSYPMEFFLLAGRNYIGHPEVGRACHQERKALELALFAGNRDILENLYTEWAEQGIGREVVMIAQNKN